jgi:hypothetical protein
MEYQHVPTRLFNESSHFGTSALVQGAHFDTGTLVALTYLLPHGRKFSPNVLSELQNLQLQCIHTGG